MSTNYTLPSIRAAPAQTGAVLDYLFEPSIQLHELCVPTIERRSFMNYSELISNVESDLTSLLNSGNGGDIAKLDEILGSHPHLGAKHVNL